MLTPYCEDPFCDNCRLNHKICTACKATNSRGQPLFLIEDLGLCTTIPKEKLVGWGLKTGSSNIYARCTSSSCAYCRNDNAVCESPTLAPATTCESFVHNCAVCISGSEATTCSKCNNGMYTNSFISAYCVPPPQGDSGYGLVSGLTGITIFMRCFIPKCVECSSDYTVCTRCIYPYIWNSADSICTFPNPGQGWDKSSSPPTTTKSCAPGCDSCVLDSNFCDIPCSDFFCATCPASISTCTECKGYAPNQPYLLSSICYLQSALPAGYGIDKTKVKEASACSDSVRCNKCQPDSSSCTECKYTAGWYMGRNAGNTADECQHATNSPTFPEGFGPNLTTNLVEACTLLNCKTCPNNKETCTVCKDAGGWYLGKNSGTSADECQHATNSPTFPVGFGPNLVTFKVEPCALANCKTCSANKNICTACRDDQGWYMGQNIVSTADECQHATTSPTFPTGYGPNPSNLKVEPCTLANCKTCSADKDV
jgi:hypothetical protein